MFKQRQVLSTQILSVRAGRTLGFLGHAHICDGSVLRRTLLGWTPRHAARRAIRAIGITIPIQIGFS